MVNYAKENDRLERLNILEVVLIAMRQFNLTKDHELLKVVKRLGEKSSALQKKIKSEDYTESEIAFWKHYHDMTNI